MAAVGPAPDAAAPVRAQPPHKVNLNEPALTIMVQMLKSCATLSVLPAYKARPPHG
jgi:tRNA(Ser,Leu) C12 N-acetylase TAN1